MSNASEPPCPQGFVQLKGVATDGQSAEWFLVAKDSFLGHIRSAHNRNKQLEALCVPCVLGAPAGIWEGLQREGGHHTLVYAGRIERRYLQGTDIEIPSPPGKVFAVYVRPTRATHGQRIVDYWEFVPEDASTPGFPESHSTRYGRRLWPPD